MLLKNVQIAVYLKLSYVADHLPNNVKFRKQKIQKTNIKQLEVLECIQLEHWEEKNNKKNPAK